MKIEIITSEDYAEQWDNYIRVHKNSNLYHLFGWKDVIQKTYGHKIYYLIALKSSDGITDEKVGYQSVIGVLPLVWLENFFFGNLLFSIPFFDMGGMLADSEEIEYALLSEAVRLGKDLGAEKIELRHTAPCSYREIPGVKGLGTYSEKVRMLFELPDSSEVLMKSFKSKLRSQIRRPLKEGLYSKIGGLELLEDFYEVFVWNMRDLGSPVHSKVLMSNVLKTFPEDARIVLVYKEKQPVACSLVVGFRDTLENPWASSLRQYSRFSPNMLLYWTMLAYACDSGYRFFDFGRSTPGEGTYRFKKQWGARPVPLHWQYIYLKEKPAADGLEKSRFARAIHYWKKLPVPVTRIIGPAIRKHIGL